MKRKLFIKIIGILFFWMYCSNVQAGGLIYSTYLGGNAIDQATGVAVDSTGAVFITGLTNSANFPITSGSYDTIFDAGQFNAEDVFISKIDPSGSTLLYSTYLGGNFFELGSGIAVDNLGNAYITGITGSIDFPVTPGAYHSISVITHYVAFITKLNSSGSDLVYSAILGGSDYDNGRSIAIDSAGNAYITGITSSSDFPVTPNAFDTTYSGNTDVFIAELNSSGSTLMYSTFLGGSGDDQGWSIAIDNDGNAYVTGYTNSTDYPVTTNAYQTTYSGGWYDAFVTKLNSTGTGLIYSTYLGAGGEDRCFGIAVDENGNAYVTGFTGSPDFPVTANAYDTIYNEGQDIFVTEMDTAGSNLVYSTFVGGGGHDIGFAITLDTENNAYITGYTDSPNFPTTIGSFDSLYNPGGTYGYEVYACKLDSRGSNLLYSTYIGGTNDDVGRAICLDNAGNVYITGDTQSLDFPTIPGSFDTTYHGSLDAFLVKLSLDTVFSSFTGTPTQGVGPLMVQYTDSSLGNPFHWSWNFGDGSTTNQQNPSHTYEPVSTLTYYTVRLIVQDSSGTSIVKKPDFIQVLPAIPPAIGSVPSLKLFIGQELDQAFDLATYNIGGVGTTYSIISNFLDLVSLSESTINQSAYATATSGINTFQLTNTFGSISINNKVKYSTYKIYKLPKIGLNPGESCDINLMDYTFDSSGNSLPLSYGTFGSLSIGDTTMLDAQWSNPSTITVSALSGFTTDSPVNIDVIASPSATAPFGTDMDKERILVYPNLLANGTFSTALDTTYYGLESTPSQSVMATHSWLTSYTDSAGNPANGVWCFTFADSSCGIKVTPFSSNYVRMSALQWYTMRMRLVADSDNAHQALLFGFNNLVGTGIQTDISAYVNFGISTIWTWMETPLLVHGISASGYLQFLIKASTTGNVYVDELQILHCAPTLVDANRSDTRLHYPYGTFNFDSATTGWGQQLYFNSYSNPILSISGGQLQLNFMGTAIGQRQEGIKWTANNLGSDAYTVPVTPGRELGVRATVTIQSGSFNSLGIILIAAYGVQSSGQQTIGGVPGNFIASAGVGVLTGGTYRTVGKAMNNYYQFQFGIRNDIPGVLTVNDIDFDLDKDDPNFGYATLFP